MADFSIGDKAVYPGYGVAEITGIENKEFSGTSQSFYVLRVLGKDMTLMVPEKNAVSIGLRNLISGKEIDDIYDLLKKRGEPISTSTWNRRQREYNEKIRSGSLSEISSVLRDLCILRAEKELSYGERSMLETARGLVVQELALAKGISEEELDKEIDALFDPPKGSESASS